jgi:hypothetical protein
MLFSLRKTPNHLTRSVFCNNLGMKSLKNILTVLLVSTLAISAQAAPKEKHIRLKRLAPVLTGEPSLSKGAWLEEEAEMKARAIDEFYTPEVTNAVEGRAQALEVKHENPRMHATPWEAQQANDSREDLAKFTAKETLSERIKNLFRRADQSSGGMKAITAMQTLTGGEVEKEPSKEEKPAVKKIGTRDKKEAFAMPVKKEEAPIPTKLKTRMNVVKGQGEVRFMNPVVTTSVNLDANSKADNNVAVRMEKELSVLDLRSNVDYGLGKKVVSVNVSKKITDEISANLTSRHSTAGEEISGGKRSEEAVNMLYSISF